MHVGHAVVVLLGALNQTSSPLHGHPIATNLIALASARTMCRALPSLLHGLVTAWVGAALLSSAMGDTDSPLNDAIFARGVGALAPDAIVFIGQGGNHAGRAVPPVAVPPVAVVVSPGVVPPFIMPPVTVFVPPILMRPIARMPLAVVVPPVFMPPVAVFVPPILMTPIALMPLAVVLMPSSCRRSSCRVLTIALRCLRHLASASSAMTIALHHWQWSSSEMSIAPLHLLELVFCGLSSVSDMSVVIAKLAWLAST